MKSAWSMVMFVGAVLIVLVAVEVAGRSGWSPVGKAADLFTRPS